MNNQLITKISVTFYPKSNITEGIRKKSIVYATIAFKGTVAKMSTGIKCENPEKAWAAGMFHGKRYSDENHKLLTIRKTIESYDSRFFRDAEQIKAVYHGVENNDIPMTILGVIDEKYEEKKSEVGEGTMHGYESAINTFKRWMKDSHNVDYGVHRNHPHKISNRIVKAFYKWSLTKPIGSAWSVKKAGSTVKESTANCYVTKLAALYEMFYIENSDDIDGIIPNPFRRIRKAKSRYDDRQKALERELDWKWIEKIEKLKYQLPEGLVTNKVDLRKRNFHGNKLSLNERSILHDKYRILSLILAYTGLAFVELGKEDVFQIQRSISGPVLTGHRVKTKEKYAIPVTPKLEVLIAELGSLPWKPFIKNGSISDYKYKNCSYMLYYNYLNDRLTHEIGYDEDETISPHRFRHSFAMRMLNHFKFSIHVVARMLGDSEKMVRKHYADYADETITAVFNEEMARYLNKNNNDDESEEEIAV